MGLDVEFHCYVEVIRCSFEPEADSTQSSHAHCRCWRRWQRTTGGINENRRDLTRFGLPAAQSETRETADRTTISPSVHFILSSLQICTAHMLQSKVKGLDHKSLAISLRSTLWSWPAAACLSPAGLASALAATQVACSNDVVGGSFSIGSRSPE